MSRNLGGGRAITRDRREVATDFFGGRRGTVYISRAKPFYVEGRGKGSARGSNTRGPDPTNI